MNNMKISEQGFNLLEQVECGGNIDKYLVAYQDPAGIWTIGMGNTYYADGSRVKKGDILTHNQAMDLFYDVIPTYERIVNTYILKPLRQCQFDALVSFVYNVPKDAFVKSTLARLINRNPDDPEIDNAWLDWVYFTDPISKKKVESKGLFNRRKAEIELYFL